MEHATALSLAGVACVVIAVIGGGLTVMKVDIPVLKSRAQQILLGVFGLALVALSEVNGRGPAGVVPTPPPVEPVPPRAEGTSTTGTQPPPPVVVMSPLMHGINLQGLDFDSIGVPANNPQDCAEICRTDDRCDSMTFVLSRGTCWPKSGVPPESPHPDMVSAIKVRG